MIYSSINNFVTFDSNVWGTVSDWMIVFITAITGYLIWQTLKSQLGVQKLQSLSTNIEQNRFRVEVMPKFKLDYGNHPVVFIDGQYRIPKVYMGISLNKHRAYDVIVTVKADDEGWHCDPWEQKYDFQEAKTNIPFSVRFDNVNLSPMGKPVLYVSGLRFKVEYSDVYGNRYEQRLTLVALTDNVNVINKPPQLTSFAR